MVIIRGRNTATGEDSNTTSIDDEDLHWPIALSTFVLNVDKVQVPNTIQEAFQHPKWREAVLEEIRALKKMRHEISLIYLLERILWAANGFLQ